MQFGFFGKKDKKEETPPATPKRRGGNFYDDEIDTVSRVSSAFHHACACDELVCRVHTL